MNNLLDMLWIELRKAIRSKMPPGTALMSLFMPLGIAFLLFVSRNPEISKKLGLVSAKADLMAYAATDWAAYTALYGQVIAAGGFILSIFVISWVFGREFSDGTLKDMLAVPIPRTSILLAKFIVVAVWSALLTTIICIAGLILGLLLNLPGDPAGAVLLGSTMIVVTAILVIAVVLPFALFASVGRGYLLPIALAIMALMVANLVVLIGRGDVYPWAIPMLYAQAETPLSPASYWIVLITCLGGLIATILWWKYADQPR